MPFLGLLEPAAAVLFLQLLRLPKKLGDEVRGVGTGGHIDRDIELRDLLGINVYENFPGRRRKISVAERRLRPVQPCADDQHAVRILLREVGPSLADRSRPAGVEFAVLRYGVNEFPGHENRDAHRLDELVH